MRIGRITAVAFASVVVVGLIACSPSSSSSTSSSATPASSGKAAGAPAPGKSKGLPHACDVLTTADAQLVLGPDGMVERAGDVDCDLKTSQTFGPSITVKIQEISGTWDGSEVDVLMQMDKTARKVSDLGEGAYTYGGGSIVFKKGAYEVTIIMSVYKGEKSPYDAAHLIAERLAARL